MSKRKISPVLLLVFDNFEVALAAEMFARAMVGHLALAARVLREGSITTLRGHGVLIVPAPAPKVAMRMKLIVRTYNGKFRADLPPRPVPKA